MVVTEVGMVTDVSKLDSNAQAPMVVTEVGMIPDVSKLCWNA